MMNRGNNDAPMSPWATVAVVIGGLVGSAIGFMLAGLTSREAPYESVLVSEWERANALERELLSCRREQEQWMQDAQKLPACRTEVPATNIEPTSGLPPTRLPLEDSILLPEVVVDADEFESEELDADAREWAYAEPPRKLGEDDFRAYVQDPAPDGEVMPGPVAE